MTAIRADRHEPAGATLHDGVDIPTAVDCDLACHVRDRGAAGQVPADLDRDRGHERLDMAVRVAAIANGVVAIVAGLAERELDDPIATGVEVGAGTRLARAMELSFAVSCGHHAAARHPIGALASPQLPSAWHVPMWQSSGAAGDAQQWGPLQTPAEHTSPCVQAFAIIALCAIDLAGVPNSSPSADRMSQRRDTNQGCAAHPDAGTDARQHTSPCVQALPSSHGVPSAWLGFEQLSICELGSLAVAEHALANKKAAVVVSRNDKMKVVCAWWLRSIGFELRPDAIPTPQKEPPSSVAFARRTPEEPLRCNRKHSGM